MRKPGFISPRRAAKIIGVHSNTVYAWCQRAVRGEPAKLRRVEQNEVTGYYWIPLDEARQLKDKK